MTRLSELLEKLHVEKTDLSRKERDELYYEVEQYINGLERRLFKRYRESKRIPEEIRHAAHTERILALHDFIRDFALPRGKSIPWALATFLRRFVDVETTLTLRRSGLSIPGAEVGFSDRFVIFFREYSAASRKCKGEPDTVSYKCIEEAYFANKEHAGKKARENFRNLVGHALNIAQRTIFTEPLNEEYNGYSF